MLEIAAAPPRPFLSALSATCLHTAVHWKNVIVALESRIIVMDVLSVLSHSFYF